MLLKPSLGEQAFHSTKYTEESVYLGNGKKIQSTMNFVEEKKVLFSWSHQGTGLINFENYQ